MARRTPWRQFSDSCRSSSAAFWNYCPMAAQIPGGPRAGSPGIVGHSTIEMRGDSAAGHVIRTLTPLAVRDLHKTGGSKFHRCFMSTGSSAY